MRRQAAVRVTRPVTPALSQRYPLCKAAPAFLTHLLSSWYLSLPALALLQEEGLCLEAPVTRSKVPWGLEASRALPHPGTFTLRPSLQEESSHESSEEEMGGGRGPPQAAAPDRATWSPALPLLAK